MAESVEIGSRFLDQPYLLAGRLIDPVAGTLEWAGLRQHIRRKPLEVLALLAQAGSAMVLREVFIDVVWGGNSLVGDRALNDAISVLRQLLDDKDRQHPLLRTIPRRGYQLMVSATDPAERPSVAFAPGARISTAPDLQLLRQLASSARYDTWQAERISDGKVLVVRICRSEQQRRWLKREVTLLRVIRERLGGRQDLVAIESWQLDDPPYTLTMRLAAHGSLAQWVQQRGGWSAISGMRRLQLLVQVADALAAVHQAGLVHGSVQPSAILIDRTDAGEEFACLGGFAAGEVPDRAVLSALNITLTGLPESSQPVLQRRDDLGNFAELIRRVLLGQLEGPLVAAQLPADLCMPAVAARVDDFLLRSEAPDAWPGAEAFATQLRSLAAEPAANSTEATPAGPHAGSLSAAMPLGVPEGPAGQAVSPASAAAVSPTEFAPYRVLDVLGEGGMGVVYLAEQAAPLQRRVALKVLREAAPDAQLLARFHAERRTLALMQHPHIAAAYDVGQTASGRPYFVMEFVPGLDIWQFCMQHRLHLRERIQLFLQTCAGVLHAHQRGVVHRDLKPGNLLVCASAGQKGMVKIIDFGVAKMLMGPLGADLFRTRLGTTIGTPLYCSPEQLDPYASDIDTRADIYSLGVVLFQLLAGITPLDGAQVSELTARQLAQALRERSAPDLASRFATLSPSAQLAHAQQCQIAASELIATLRGDLSWILARCLEHDPEDRYPSVLDLQRDLERWLEQRPVEARPITPAYRLRKFYRRHRLRVLAAAVVALLLLATTLAAIVGFVRARHSAALAEQSARESTLAAAFQTSQLRGLDLPGMGQDIRAALLESAARLRLDPAALTAFRTTLDETNFVDLARQQLNRRYLQPALAVLERDYGDFPALKADLLLALSASARALGALDTADQASAQVQTLAQNIGQAAGALPWRASLEQGRILMDRGMYAEAQSVLETSLAGLTEALGATDPETLECMQVLLQLHLHRRSGAALPLARAWIALKSRPARSVADPDAQRLLGEALLMAGNTDEARVVLEGALSTITGSAPAAVLRRSQLELALADVYAESGKLAELDQMVRRALEGYRSVLGERHEMTLQLSVTAAENMRRDGRLDDASALYEQTLTKTFELYGNDHLLAVGIRHKQAMVLHRRGHPRAALAQMEALRTTLQSLGGGNDYVNQWTLKSTMPEILLDLGRLDDAGILLKELQAEAGGSPVWKVGAVQVRQQHARLLSMRGRPEEALSALRQTIADARAGSHDNASLLFGLDSQLGELLQATGQSQEAEIVLARTAQAQAKLEFDRRVRLPFTLNRLAALRLAQSQYPTALELSHQAIAGARAFMHPADPRWAEIWALRARVLLRNGQPDAARRALFESAQVIESAQLGDWHRELLRTTCAEVTAGQSEDSALSVTCNRVGERQPISDSGIPLPRP